MRFFQRDRPCKDCAKVLARLEALEEQLRGYEVRYLELYEIARRNLAKMAQRAAGEDQGDEMSKHRQALVARKLRKEA